MDVSDLAVGIFESGEDDVGDVWVDDGLTAALDRDRLGAEQPIGDQHHKLRDLFRQGQRRPWSEWNVDAVTEWLALNGGRA